MSVAIAGRSDRFTVEEYLAQERASELKNEYYQGRILTMAGASHAHNLIVLNIGGELRQALKGGPCNVLPSDMRLRCPTGLYTYPDVSVVCGEAELVRDGHKDTLVNPCVLVEVLSSSTEARDRGEKFEHYRWIRTLRDYLLVAQDRVLIERFSREPQAAEWTMTPITDALGTVNFAGLPCEIAVAEIYRNVDFAKAESSPRLMSVGGNPAGE